MYWTQLSLMALSCVVMCDARCFPVHRHVSTDPDVTRNVTEIIASRGYAFEEHYVTTQDGFILGLQRIPRGRSEERNTGGKQIVFLQHGFLADATNWVMDSATESLGYILADCGFDVWLGNIRGNDYSRRHVKYLPNQHIFWNWSWQEMAGFDLPAMINYVLQVTGQKQLFYVGHSQGTLIAFNGFADNPDLGNKIKAFFALAPVYTLNNVTKIAKDASAVLYPLVKKLDPNLTFDLLPGDIFRALIKLGFCAYPIAEKICYDLVELVVGMDSKDIDESRVPVYIAHLFEGTSFKDSFHYAQVGYLPKPGIREPVHDPRHAQKRRALASLLLINPAYNQGLFSSAHDRGKMIVNKKCQKFDYGPTGNKRHYNQTTAPLCNVQGMPTPTMMFVATKDKLGDPGDNAALKPQIKNLVHYEVIQGWNHLDFLYGKDAHILLYPKLVAMMKTHFNKNHRSPE